MADILIRGMEMPTQCGNCPISTNTRRCTILWREFGNPSKRLQDCPLVPLPEWHGRLGDLDALQDEFKKFHDGKRSMLIDTAPTIVPAEGGSKE